MANLNFCKAFIGGRLTKDPELKTTPAGKAVCTFSVGVNKTGEAKGVDFHNIVAWGRCAEMVSKFFVKGSNILVEGRVQNRTWDDKNGQKRYVTEIIADNVYFVDSRGEVSKGGVSAENDVVLEELIGEDLPF